MAIVVDGKSITEMKYHDLQKLAKSVGIKANLKIEKLLEALTDYYSQNADKNMSEASEASGDVDVGKTKNKRPPPKKAKRRGRKPVRSAEQRVEKAVGNAGSPKHQKPAMKDTRKSPLKSPVKTPVLSTTSVKRKSPFKSPDLCTKRSKKESQVKSPMKSPTSYIKGAKHESPLKSPTKCTQRGSPTVNIKGKKKESPVKTPGGRNVKSALHGSCTPRFNFGSGKKLEEKTKLTPQMKSVILRRSLSLSLQKRKFSNSSGRQRVEASPKSNRTKTTPPVTVGLGKSPNTPNVATADAGNLAETTVLTPAIKAIVLKSLSPQKRKRTYSGQKKSVEAVVPSEPSPKRRRRSTFDKTPEKDSSPGVGVLLNAMKDNMDSAERKQSLMTAISSRVMEKKKNQTSKTVSADNSQRKIPRFVAYFEKNKPAGKKPVTPGNKDWQKIHNKEFSKFDSIDVYLEKKRKRNEQIASSVKKTQKVLDDNRAVVSQVKNMKTPTSEQYKKKAVFKNAEVKENLVQTKKVSPFKPVVLKTKHMNLNFNKTPQNSALVKHDKEKLFGTQERHASCVKPGKSTATPFKFNATLNTTGSGLNTTVGSARKPSFDLKASLSRPITWKAHKGKLKPLTDLSDPKYLYSDVDVKTHKTQTRGDRRKAAEAHRQEKKHQSHMKRRGIES